MNGKLICLLGKSGSGKSTIEKVLEEKHGFIRAISTTTRKMREGEIQGVNYNYVTLSEFHNLLDSGEVLEYTEYNGEFYCLTKDSINLDKGYHVVVVERNGHKQLKDSFSSHEMISFLVEVNDKERLLRALNREHEPNCQVICERFLSDKEHFNGIEEEVDYVVNNSTPHISEVMNEMDEVILSERLWGK